MGLLGFMPAISPEEHVRLGKGGLDFDLGYGP